DQPLEDVRRIVDDIGIEPEHPILIVKRTEQEVISRPRQDGTARRLVDCGITGDSRRHVESEILLEQYRATKVVAGGEAALDHRMSIIGAVAFEDTERQLPVR